MVGLLGRGISQSQGRYLHRGQHKHRINVHTDIHALSEIRAFEDSSCLDRAATVIGVYLVLLQNILRFTLCKTLAKIHISDDRTKHTEILPHAATRSASVTHFRPAPVL
jgi:hypothetical protein